MNQSVRRYLIFGVAIAIGLAMIAGPADAERKKRRRYDKTEKRLYGGTHWRIKTEKGPIHVWVPRNYHRDTAGTVVYVHGYNTSADGAWKHHKLPQQFKRSRQNAMFIVPEAPRGNGESVRWSSLAELKKAVVRANFRLPDGPPIVIGHSGAFRTIAKWLDNRLLAEVILLDALYGRAKEFEEFIHGGHRAKHHKLIIVATDTKAKARRFARKFRYAAVRDRIPSRYKEFTKRERRSKLLYLRSQYGHMALVTNGKVIPLLLRLTPLKRL
jgi:hypothetical protein